MQPGQPDEVVRGLGQIGVLGMCVSPQYGGRGFSQQQYCRIMEVIETGWPQDRDSQIVSHAEFGAITARLWTLLRAQSMHALQPGTA